MPTSPSLLGKVKSLLRAFRSAAMPTMETSLLVGRALPQDLAPRPLKSLSRISWVMREDDPDFPHLVAFSAHQGMDEAWCRFELRRGLIMCLGWAVPSAKKSADSAESAIGPAPAEKLAAVAWATRSDHLVDHIFHDFDPGPAGCAILNCFVLPEFRGRGIQHILIDQRLVWASRNGVRFVYTVPSDRRSLKNLSIEGFVPVVRFDIIRFLSLKLSFLRRLSFRVPTGRLRARGIPRSPHFKLITHERAFLGV